MTQLGQSILCTPACACAVHMWDGHVICVFRRSIDWDSNWFGAQMLMWTEISSSMDVVWGVEQSRHVICIFTGNSSPPDSWSQLPLKTERMHLKSKEDPIPILVNFVKPPTEISTQTQLSVDLWPFHFLSEVTHVSDWHTELHLLCALDVLCICVSRFMNEQSSQAWQGFPTLWRACVSMELPVKRCAISRARTAGLLKRSGKTPFPTGDAWRNTVS